MTRWIIVVNVAVFVLDMLLGRTVAGGPLTRWGDMTLGGIRHGQVWRLITFQFLHAGPFHLLFNMLWLYFLGPLVEWRLNKQRFLAFYLICGVAAGLACALLEWLQAGTTGVRWHLVGASGGIFGVMAAAVVLLPRATLQLWLPPITISLKLAFWVLVGLALITIFTGGFNAGGEAGHLGGAAVGYALAHKLRLLNFVDPLRRRQKFWKPGDTNFFREDMHRDP